MKTQTKPDLLKNQVKPKQTQPNQTRENKPDQTRPNQTNVCPATTVRRYTDEQTGYKLSQKWIYHKDTLTPVAGVTFNTEQDIFQFLGLKYIPPHLRCA